MSESWKWDELTARKYDKSIQVATFLGGFILATLTGLIAQSNNNPILCTMAKNQTSPFCSVVAGDGKPLSSPPFWPDYKEIFIGAMGLVGTLFIVSVYGMKAAFVHQKKDLFSEISHLLYEMGIAGILILFPFIVMPFSLIFGIIVLSVAVTWICLYIYYHWPVFIAKPRSY